MMVATPVCSVSASGAKLGANAVLSGVSRLASRRPLSQQVLREQPPDLFQLLGLTLDQPEQLQPRPDPACSPTFWLGLIGFLNKDLLAVGRRLPSY